MPDPKSLIDNPPKITTPDSREQSRQERLAMLTSLRDNYSEEPQEEPISGEKRNKYHKGWFVGVIDTCDVIILDGFITNESIITQIRKFQQYVRDNVQGTKRISADDIREGNEILNLLIAHLSES